jgi:branched-chain amino acid aminotransferase
MAYLNGRFLPQSEAYLPLHDAGFVWGATVTDLCRTFHHRLYRLSDHLTRFRRSCQSAHIPQVVGDDELALLAERLIAHNAALLPSDGDLALVLIATPGAIEYYTGLPGNAAEGKPTLAMQTFPLPFHRYRRLFEEGAHLVVPATRQVPASSVDPRIKQRSRLHWWIADQEARAAEPGALALLLDSEGCLTETAAANFLLVRNGRVLSPPPPSILGGISLQVTQELCQRFGIAFLEQPLHLDDCQGADEALLASTPYGIAGVSRINGIALPWPGPILRQLQQGWNLEVGLDISRQILSHR